tara:strand:+ start:15513 stop:15659 length:147 start_codon:yes stop_codon:yes gene_type:complete
MDLGTDLVTGISLVPKPAQGITAQLSLLLIIKFNDFKVCPHHPMINIK